MTESKIDASGAPHSCIRRSPSNDDMLALAWPSREVVAREIRRAMLDNPTDESFNKRAEKREAIANDVADVIMARFESARTAPPANRIEQEGVREALELARKRIEYLGQIGHSRHAEANERDFFPPIDRALTALAAKPTAVVGLRESALEAAAQDLVDKVDRGEARSKQSYAAFKSALALPQGTRPPSLPGREEIAAALYAVEYDATAYEFRDAHEAVRTLILKMADTAIAALTTTVRDTTKCGCLACDVDGPHTSSCAVHNGTALAIGPCDCGARGSSREALDAIRKAIIGALIIAESEWVFDGAHPMRGVALENLRKAADSILSLITNGTGEAGGDVRKVLAPFYKTVDVMKSARNSPTHTMHVWADDMKAVEDVMLFLETTRDALNQTEARLPAVKGGE